MKHMSRIAAALLLWLVAVPACGGSEPAKTYLGHGTVTAVDAPTHKITLDHEEIPGLMVAMTMTFDVAPDVALEGFEPGTAVDFEVKHEGSTYLVTQLRRAGPSAPR
jgi:Cu/Ag efflux protein CusF